MHYVIIEGQGQELLHALCYHRGAGPRATACIVIIEGQGQELLHALCYHRGAGPRATACIMLS